VPFGFQTRYSHAPQIFLCGAFSGGLVVAFLAVGTKDGILQDFACEYVNRIFIASLSCPRHDI
jgi:hypothetical protein